MKNYEKQIEEFGKEIADEVVQKMRDPKFTPYLERYKVATSISRIHDVEIMVAMEDLEKSISKHIKRMLEMN
jgi:hypothetical protein